MSSENVKDHGAVGDGTTDDAGAINDAIAAASSSDARVVLFPAGDYLINSSIDINVFGLKVIGAGHSDSYSGSLGRTRIIKDGNFDGLTITAGSVAISGVHVDGKSGNSGDGISIEESRCVLRDVSVTNQGNDGLRIGKGSANKNLWRLYNVLSLNNGNHGIFIDDSTGPNANAGVAVGLDLRDNDGDGLQIANSIDNQFLGLHSAGNAGYGINLDSSAQGNNFFFPYLENNSTGDGIMISGSKYNMVFGVRKQVDDGWIDNGEDNFILGRKLSHNDMFHGRGNISFKDLHITHEDVSGLWKLHKDSSNRNLLLELVATTANADVEILHGGSGTTNLNLKDGGLKIGNGTRISKYLSATKTYDIPSLADGAVDSTTVTVLGAETGDLAIASMTSITSQDIQITAHVQSSDTVRVLFKNVSGSAIDPGSGTLRVGIIKH